MDLRGARVLVAGSTGVLGAKIARALHRQGAQLVLAGRDHDALAALSMELDDAPVQLFDALEGLIGAKQVVDAAADSLGGLDMIVVAIGVAAFGPVGSTDEARTQHLITVNTLAPMALIRAALPYMEHGGTVAALSAVLADYPTAHMASYSAGKAALSAWLVAVRHEHRGQGLTVFDIWPPHLDTGLVDRALGGSPPTMPAPADTDAVVEQIVSGLRHSAHDLYYDLSRDEVRVR